MKRERAEWTIAGVANLGSRLHPPLVTLTNGYTYRAVRFPLDVKELKMMTLKEIEVIAVGLITPGKPASGCKTSSRLYISPVDND